MSDHVFVQGRHGFIVAWRGGQQTRCLTVQIGQLLHVMFRVSDEGVRRGWRIYVGRVA